MGDIWQTWVGDRSVEEFLDEVDEAIVAGLFADRRAAFVDYAQCVLTWLATRDGPKNPQDKVGATALANQLLAHALGEQRPMRRTKAFATNRAEG